MSEKPLRNVILCCTSVTQEERSLIMRQALEMGAVVQADLTSDVTHLIVAKLQTEKYKFAARHRTDLRLMAVEWVPAVHAIWITGRDVNLPWSEDKYRLPIFHGLRICVTNLDVDLRMQIEQLVTQHGAAYSGDLTKENTHLIAGTASGKKWEAVLAWQCGISVVGIEWVYESIKRGASLDEKYFGLELSPEVRGQTSWFPPKVLPRANILDGGVIESGIGEKRRRGSGMGVVSRKRLSKRASNLMADGLWTEILKSEASNDHLDSNLPTIQLDLPSERLAQGAQDDELSTLDLLPDELTRGIFEDRRFHVCGFAPREDAIVRRTLETNGGQLTANPLMADLIVVPQNGRPPRFEDSRATMVTEFWLERCLTLHRLEDPSVSFTSTPFQCTLPIPRMEQLSICTSGFSAVDSMHIEKMVKKIGAIACETLTKGRSILLAASRECRKYKLAKDNGTRVVGIEWLWECIKRNKMIGVTDYALDGIIGSQCRIDGNVALKQRRSLLLHGTVCCVQEPSEEGIKLSNLVQAMGGRLVRDHNDASLTHVIGNVPVASEPHHRNAHQVSTSWLTETFALIRRQPESSYPCPLHENDENTPPDGSNADKHGKNNHQKLASEVNAIRKRIGSSTSRRSPRKILGRATTLPQIDQVSLMMATNEDESMDTGAAERPSTQGVTYSDPETVEKQRELLHKLGALEDESSCSSITDRPDSGSARSSMRATGLDDTRKLRR